MTFNRRALARLFAALPFGALAAAKEQLPSGAEILKSFDARDWAKAFVAHVRQIPGIPTDEACMTGWFANALMRGFDEHRRALDVERKANVYRKGCKLAGPGRGDCDYFIGLPKTFEYPKDVNEYGIPHGWCDYCWLVQPERVRFGNGNTR